MKKIIHLSDLHVGYRDCGKRFHTIVRNIKKLQQPAKDFIIVITGDLADNANINEHREEAASGIEELQRAGFRVLVVPGNHDYGTGTFGNPVFVSIFKNRFFGTVETNYPRLDIFDDMAFIGLDSTAEELSWHDRLLAQGELGKDQLQRLKNILEDPLLDKRKIIVYLHHHPFDFKVGRQLKDSDNLKEVLENRADLLLFGHYHRNKADARKVYHGKWGIPRCYNAGTATHKNGNPGFHRVIDMTSSDPVNDYDGKFDTDYMT